MSFRRGGGKKRRDANEAEICSALRNCGAYVFQVSGDGLPDLLVMFHGRWTPLEVKTARGRFRNSQSALMWPVVRDVEQALKAIGVKA